jgi:tRNA(Ile)-lysidine synthetase-like protein
LTIKIERGLAGDLLGEIINEARLVRESGGRDWLVVALDDEALPARLVVRMRRPGERARVLGQARTKKLKNLMIDHKIPTSRRATWPIVATPDGRYVWSPSLPPAVEFAARDKSHRLAILRASVA